MRFKGLNVYLAMGLILLTASLAGWLVLFLAQFALWFARIAGILSIPLLIYGLYLQVRGDAPALPRNGSKELEE